MSYTIIPPPDELKDFVRHFWARSWNNGIYYATAATTIEITFELGQQQTISRNLGFRRSRDSLKTLASIRPAAHLICLVFRFIHTPCPFFFNFSVADVENGLIDLDLFLEV